MTPPSPARLSWRPFSALAGVFLLLTLPLLFARGENPYTWDETSFYFPAIRQIREHWPRVDLLQDSLSATAPGYQYVLAGVSFVTGVERLPLRFVNLLVSLGVLALLWRWWPADRSWRFAFLAMLPLAASNFFVKSSAYVVTDNAALLATAGTLGALLFAPAGGGLGRASVLSTAAVFIRQSSLWLMAPLGFQLLRAGPPRWRLALVLPPLAAVLWMVVTWKGLVPPRWQADVKASGLLVPAAGAYLLSVLGVLGSFYYLAARPANWREDVFNRFTALGAAAGLVFAFAGTNIPDYEAGRWGGYLWEVAARVPALGAFSPVFIVLAPAGGAMLAILGRRLWLEAGHSVALPWLAACLAWAGAGLSNRLVFHRYFEPTILLLLIAWLALVLRSRGPDARVAGLPLAILGAGQLAITLITAHGRTFGFL